MLRFVLLIAAAGVIHAQELNENCKDVQGVLHKLNDSYIGEDGCNICRCHQYGSACTKRFCDPKQPKARAELNKCVDNKGNLHEVGETYTHVDGCNTCNCKQYGGVCTRKFCFEALDEKTMCVDGAGKTMAGGESWLADDGCNKCTCGPFGAICTEKFCVKHSETGGDIIEFPDGTQIADESGDSPCRVNGETKFPGVTWLTEDNCNICTCTGMNGKVDCTEEGCRVRFLKLTKGSDDGSGSEGLSFSFLLALLGLLVFAF